MALISNSNNYQTTLQARLARLQWLKKREEQEKAEGEIITAVTKAEITKEKKKLKKKKIQKTTHNNN